MVKKAMIMAAGVGSRLDPLTQKTPKPMIPIVNKPIMEIIIDHLAKFGITSVIANTHYLAEVIHDKFDNYDTGLNLNYIHEEKLSGTAGGVKKCEWFFDKDETFVVVSGDALTDVNLDVLIKKHKASGAIATMGLKEIPREKVSAFGVVIIDENGKIQEFQEKPSIQEAKSNLVNTGIYVFETRIFDYIPADTFYDFAKNVFPALMANNEPLYAHIIEEYWTDIGTIHQYKQSSFDALNEKVNIAKPTSIKNKQKNVLIGEGSSLAQDVILEGNCIIGNNCVIKENVRIKDSIIWDDCIISSNAKLEDCIIANNVCIGENSHITPGCIVADSCKIKNDEHILETVKV